MAAIAAVFLRGRAMTSPPLELIEANEFMISVVLEEWFGMMKLAMAKLDAFERGYETQRHSFERPANRELVAQLTGAIDDERLRDQMAAFYSVANGVYLEVHNHYHLFGLESILDPEEECPQRLYCDGSRVLVFGKDGGGNHLAARLVNPAEIVYMRMGEVEDGIYFDEVYTDWEKPPIRVIASTFDEFLDRLLWDVDAYVRGDRSWKFMVPRAMPLSWGALAVLPLCARSLFAGDSRQAASGPHSQEAGTRSACLPLEASCHRWVGRFMDVARWCAPQGWGSRISAAHRSGGGSPAAAGESTGILRSF